MTVWRLTAVTLAMLVLCCLPGLAEGGAEPVETAAAIMARVAANQDRSEAERGHYVYVQHARVLSRKGKTLMCEEVTDSRLTPTETGTHAEMLKLDGRVLVKKRYVTYTKPLPEKVDATVEKDHDSVSITLGDDDRELVEQLRSDLTTDTSRDGVNRKLFPLSSKGQDAYTFELLRRERRNGRDVFHVEFRPRDKAEFGWKGDAFIDVETSQPVLVSTAMARKIPLAVRSMLGTSVPGLGFTIVYAPQVDGVWFPVSLGTEFKLKVLFFFERQILMDAQNTGFEKTHVKTTMVPAEGAVGP